MQTRRQLVQFMLKEKGGTMLKYLHHIIFQIIIIPSYTVTALKINYISISYIKRGVQQSHRHSHNLYGLSENSQNIQLPARFEWQ